MFNKRAYIAQLLTPTKGAGDKTPASS